MWAQRIINYPLFVRLLLFDHFDTDEDKHVLGRKKRNLHKA